MRQNVTIDDIPIIWETNLENDAIREFYEQHFEQIANIETESNPEPGFIEIPFQIGFLPFRDGFCFWSANNLNHLVIYRSALDWQLWDARQLEIEELREEQATERAIEITLAAAEDKHLADKLEVAFNNGDYELASLCAEARQNHRLQFQDLIKFAAHRWTSWSPELTFARFPTSKYGIDFFLKFDCSVQNFASFAHWFSHRSLASNSELVEQTHAIYQKANALFPDNGRLIKEECLYFRRIGKLETAIKICLDALQRGLSDGTKSGFRGRLMRLQREQTRVATRGSQGTVSE